MILENATGHIRDKVKNSWISSGAKEQDVVKAIEDFQNFSKSKVMRGKISDIGRWEKKSFKEFLEFNKELGKRKSEKDSGKGKENEHKLVWSSSEINIYIPQSKEASCKLGTRTNWCNSSNGKDNTFHQYLYKEGITSYFILLKQNIDESLMHDKKDVRVFHNNNVKGFEFVKPENYSKVGVDILRPESKKTANQDTMLIWDSLNNLMKRNWFKRFCERYKIPVEMFTVRTKKIGDEYEL
jgi:hypothetical protein